MTHLAITGLGMVTAIGHDVVTACGALRCGLARPCPVDFEVPSDEGPGNVRLTGHPLRDITEGFQGMGRYLRMATHAVEELLLASSLVQAGAGFWRDSALYVGLSPTRDEEIDFYDEILEGQLAEELASLTRLPVAKARQRVFFQGHAAVLWALHEAAVAIQRGQLERALIVGVDSLLESDVLEVLHAADRLKTPVKSRGLMPGEASAAFLVESVASARRRKASIHCVVEGVEVGREQASRASGARSAGVALSEVMARLLAGGRTVGAIQGDLNGEDARAEEWGNALMRLSATHDFSGARKHWPAVSLGDTGAASGAISVVAGARALSRGYAPEGQVLVWSSADTGEVAAALLGPVASSATPPGASR